MMPCCTRRRSRLSWAISWSGAPAPRTPTTLSVRRADWHSRDRQQRCQAVPIGASRRKKSASSLSTSRRAFTMRTTSCRKRTGTPPTSEARSAAESSRSPARWSVRASFRSGTGAEDHRGSVRRAEGQSLGREHRRELPRGEITVVVKIEDEQGERAAGASATSARTCASPAAAPARTPASAAPRSAPPAPTAPGRARHRNRRAAPAAPGPCRRLRRGLGVHHAPRLHGLWRRGPALLRLAHVRERLRVRRRLGDVQPLRRRRSSRRPRRVDVRVGPPCRSDTCVMTTCGGVGQPCCGGGRDAATSACSGGMCVACGMVGQACCAGNSCPGATATAWGRCAGCGMMGQPCCASNTCNDGLHRGDRRRHDLQRLRHARAALLRGQHLQHRPPLRQRPLRLTRPRPTLPRAPS